MLMAILSTDIKFYLSGGASNADIAASLGGVISSNEISSGALHNLFSVVTPVEALEGDVEYRCIYAKNIHSTLTLFTAMGWIDSNTPNLQTNLDIGLGTSSMSGTEQVIANQSTPPSGVVFSAPATEIGGLAIGNLAAAGTMAIWVRRTISVAAAAYTGDAASIKVGGGTPA